MLAGTGTDAPVGIVNVGRHADARHRVRPRRRAGDAQERRERERDRREHRFLGAPATRELPPRGVNGTAAEAASSGSGTASPTSPRSPRATCLPGSSTGDFAGVVAHVGAASSLG
jgi:hypothetical protein